jgi:N-sulfoglucosamine sulfohydrolase
VIGCDDPKWKWHYDLAYGKRPRVELFDRRKDPHEVHNVAADPKYAKVLAEMERHLTEELERTDDPRLVDDGRFFETPPLAGPLP